MSRESRDYRHYLTHRSCYYRPDCPRCYVYAFWDLFVFVVWGRFQP